MVENPLIGSWRHLVMDIRWRHPERFPYRLIYCVDGIGKSILVIAVLHAARHDSRWLGGFEKRRVSVKIMLMSIFPGPPCRAHRGIIPQVQEAFPVGLFETICAPVLGLPSPRHHFRNTREGHPSHFGCRPRLL